MSERVCVCVCVRACTYICVCACACVCVCMCVLIIHSLPCNGLYMCTYLENQLMKEYTIIIITIITLGWTEKIDCTLFPQSLHIVSTVILSSQERPFMCKRAHLF